MRLLKLKRIWTCWIKKVEEGKTRKVPIGADGGKTGADEKNKSTWVTYEEAKASAKSFGYDGTMFTIPNGYFFLDIDHRAIDDPLAKKLLKRFKNTYSEYSVSGKGIHIYGKCDLSRIPTEIDKEGKKTLSSCYYLNNRKLGLELYIGGLTNRFSVFTGCYILDNALTDCTEQVLQTLEGEMKKMEAAVTTTPALPTMHMTFESVDEIVDKLCKQKNGAKFQSLYYDGDISRYQSHSEADVALCTIIAFRTGPNPDLIDRIFSQSALYRKDKWGRADYRKRTIEKAIRSCGGKFYSPEYGKNEKKKTEAVKPTTLTASAGKEGTALSASEDAKPSFVIQTKDGETVSAPLLAEYMRQTSRIILVRNDGKESVQSYVYEKERGVYTLYAKDMLIGLVKRVIANYDIKLLKMRTVREACDDLMSDLSYVRQDELDAREDIINFKNCLIRVTGESITNLPHTPEILSSTQIPCVWSGRETPTPIFDRYLDTLTNGNQETKELLMQVIGVCISNVAAYRMKKALFLVGDGDTGKSQLKSLVERLVGKGNYVGIDLTEIEARFGTGVIYGTRMAGSSDMGFLTVEELRTFKRLTGGDSVFAEFKGQPAFTYIYRGFLWFCTNMLPKFGGDDGPWVYERIMVVNCTNVIPKAQQDKELLDKMYAEREGIVYKAVKALQEVIRNGYRFSEGKTVVEARKAYADTNSTVTTFIQECMKPRTEDDSYTTGTIMNVYQAWCKDNNRGYSKSSREFRKAMAEFLGIPVPDLITHTRRGSHFPLTLKTETIEQYRYVITR